MLLAPFPGEELSNWTHPQIFCALHLQNSLFRNERNWLCGAS